MTYDSQLVGQAVVDPPEIGANSPFRGCKLSFLRAPCGDYGSYSPQAQLYSPYIMR